MRQYLTPDALVIKTFHHQAESLIGNGSKQWAPGLGAAGNAFLEHIGIDDIAVELHQIKGMLRIRPHTKQLLVPNGQIKT